ncbi:GDSL-type esterase/lipase family protein [Pseudomonas sp. PLMAX]|jgi:lysophospholipase L1-like esterase|uniref:GDSL-type esterase/lipase family protein n=1 Tax=Pseudomonas sp. PLMAX TaxID=2201998 RepID=UPI0038BC39F6
MAKIVFLGDSITKATDYGSVTLTDCFAFKVGALAGYAPSEIFNAGVSSDTSGGMLARITTDVIDKAPAVCVVMALVNDVVQDVPISAYKENLRAIASRMIVAGIKVVFVSPPLDRGSQALQEKCRSYLEALEAVSIEFSAPFIDCYREYAFMYLYGVGDFYACYVDNIHQTKIGHDKLVSILTRGTRIRAFCPPGITPVSQDLKSLVLSISDYLLSCRTSSLLSNVANERAKF